MGIRTFLKCIKKESSAQLRIGKIWKLSLYAKILFCSWFCKSIARNSEGSSCLHLDDMIQSSTKAESNKYTPETHPNGKMPQFFFLMENRSSWGRERVGWGGPRDCWDSEITTARALYYVWDMKSKEPPDTGSLSKNAYGGISILELTSSSTSYSGLCVKKLCFLLFTSSHGQRSPSAFLLAPPGRGECWVNIPEEDTFVHLFH